MPEIKTPICDLLGIKVPIIQAPVGNATTPALAAAVSNAGALGMLSLTWRSKASVREQIRETQAQTNNPFGINLVLEWPQEARVNLCLEAGVRIFSFFWGDPTPYMGLLKEAGAIVFQCVGSVAEAGLAVGAGADIVVAQGWEAGGHVRGNVSTMVLVPRVVDAVSPVPVVAAGGIADSRTAKAAFALGAQAVWMGTRFLASEEALIHPRYRQALITASEEDTVHTELFNIGWPDAPHRVIRNTTYDSWVASGEPVPGERPGEDEELARDGRRSIIRYSDAFAGPDVEGDVEGLPFYAGQSAGFVDEIEPAGKIVQKIVDELERTVEPGK